MGDTNNQRAQNFENGFTTKAIDKVNFSGQSPQNVKLLESIKEVVTASAKDLYGRQDDPKYIYIVNLIMKRVKQTLSDMNVSDSLEDIKESVANSIDIKQFGSLADDIAKLLSKYNDERKKGFDELKEYLKSSETKTPTAEAASNEDGNEQLIEDISDDIEERLKENILPIFQKTISTATTKSDNVLMSTFKHLDDKIGGINTNIKKFNATTEQQFNQTNKAIDTNIKKIHSTFSNSKAAKVHQDAMHGFDKTVNSVSSLVKSVSLQQGTIKNINDNIKKVAKTVKNQDSSKLQKATIDRIDKNTRLVVSSVKKAKNEKTQKDVLDNIYKTVSKITPKTERILKTLDAKNKKKLTTHFKSVDKAMEEVYGKSIQITHNIRGMNDSIVERFKDAYHSTKKLFGKVKDKIVDNAKSIFKKTTKKLNRMTSTIMAGIATMGAVMSSAFSMVMGPIGLMLKFVFMGLKLVLKPLQWVLKLFKNPLLLVLLLGGTLFVLYKFFRPTFDKIIDKVKAVWKKVYNIWTTKIKPAVDVMMNILGDSSLPLGKRIIKAFKEGGKVLYHNFFPKGIGHFFKTMMTDHVWPFIRDHLIPFFKEHWQGILTALGLWYLIKNPFGAVGMILKLVKFAGGTLKALPGLVKGGITAAKAAGGLVGKLGGALIGAGPVGWAAAGAALIVGGALYYIWKIGEDAAAEAAKQADEQSTKLTKKMKENRKILERMDKAQDKIWNRYGEILKKAGVDKIEDKQPELYVLADGSKVDKANFDKYVQEITAKRGANVAATEGKLEEMLKDSDADFRLESSSKYGILSNMYAKIKILITSVKSFVQKYVDDKANHVDDPGLAARFTTAMQGILSIESDTYGKLDWYAEQITDTFSDGSNDDWRACLNNIFRDTQSRLKEPVTALLTRPDGRNNVSASNLLALAAGHAENIADSRNQDKIKEAMSNVIEQSDIYAMSIGGKYARAAKEAEKQLNDALSDQAWFSGAGVTEVTKQAREELKDLVMVAQRNAIATTGQELDPKKLQQIREDAIKKIYLEAKMKQKSNKKPDAALDSFIEEMEKKNASIKGEVQKFQQLDKLNDQFADLAKKSEDVKDLDRETRQKLNASVSNALSNLYDNKLLSADTRLDQMTAEQQKKLLEDVQKQLEAQDTTDSDKEDIMAALNKILNNTEETKKKAAGTTTVVQQNNIGTGGAQNAANASQTTSSRLPTQ